MHFKTRLPALILGLFISLFATVPAWAAPYMSFSPTTPVVDPGTTINLSVMLSPATAATDTLIWSASAGTVTATLHPDAPFFIGTATWKAPSEPGLYRIRARSTARTWEMVEMTLVVRGAQRLILDSDPWIFLDGLGDETVLSALFMDAFGNLSTPSALTWTSSDPEVVYVSPSGTAVAMAPTGAAVLTASLEDLPPVRVSVTIGTVQAEATFVDEADVVWVQNNEVFLDTSPIGAVVVGQVLAGSADGGFAGRAAFVQPIGGRSLVRLEAVTPSEVFSRGRFLNETPLLDEPYGDTASGASLRQPEDKALGLDCELEWGTGSELDFDRDNWSVDPDMKFVVDLILDDDEDHTESFEVYTGGSITFTAEGMALTAEVSAGAGFSCELSVLEIPIHFVGVGPFFTLGPHVSGGFGGGAEIVASGSVTIKAPTMVHTISGLRYGFGYQGEGLYRIAESGTSSTETFYAEGEGPIDVGIAITAEAEAYAFVDLGVSVGTFGWPLAEFDILRFRPAFGFVAAELQPPFDWRMWNYAGPFWEGGWGMDVSLDPLVETLGLDTLLQKAGVPTDLAIDATLWEDKNILWQRPAMSLHVEVDDPENPSEATVVYTSGPSLAGKTARLISWSIHDTAADAEPFMNATLDASGHASFNAGWPIDPIHVAVRVDDDIFGPMNLPYGIQHMTIGGDGYLPSCLGPLCAVTTPEGPAGGPWGSGGMCGDPDDTGEPGYPGSIGWGGGGTSHCTGHTAGSTGDPHLITFDGLRYAFQGAGEFILLGTTDASGLHDPNGDLEVHTRQQPLPGLLGAINTAAAVRMGTQEIEIYANPQPGDLRLVIDGVETPDTGTIHLQTGKIVFDESAAGPRYTLLWNDGSRVRVTVGYQHLTISTTLPETRHGRTSGLLGLMDDDHSNDFRTRDGVVYPPPINYSQLYDRIGHSWRVPAAERMLDIEMGGGDPTDPEFPGSFPQAIYSSDSLQEAELRCRAGGVHQIGVLGACRHDVVMLLSVSPPDELLIASIIAGHAASQVDIYGADGPIEIFVMPSRTFVNAEQSRRFHAGLSGTAEHGVTWSASGGTITGDGTWTAPAHDYSVERTYTITATSTADPTRSASATVTVPKTLLVGHQSGPTGWHNLSGNGLWSSTDGHTGIQQWRSANPSWVISPDSYQNVRLSGTVRTNGGTATVGDFIGLIFGYRSPTGACPGTDPCDLDFFLFDWKEEATGGAPEGKTLSRLNGSVSADDHDTFWLHQEGPGSVIDVLDTQYGSDEGWVPGSEHDFVITYRSDRVFIEVDGEVIFDLSPAEVWGAGTTETFPAGRFGFYTYDQINVRFLDVGIADLTP